MSVIPFILDGSNRTVVETREEYERAGGLEGDVIFIQNLNIKQIHNTKSSNASYDLRVGDEYRDHRDSGKTDLLENGTISLQPGSAVIIKIDPGYEGKLSITVFNLGKRTVQLKKAQDFCTLYVLDVREGVIPYTKDAKKIAGNSRKDLLSRVRDFIETNQTYFTIILTIATIVLTIVQIVQPLGKQEIQTLPKESREKIK